MALAIDRHGLIHDHAVMAGRVETAVRQSVELGIPLKTPTGRGTFSVAQYTGDGLVLLLGLMKARTPLPWRALEEVPDLLRGRSSVPIGSAYATDSVPGTLDAHLKRFIARATDGWVAVVLERAGVIEIDRSPPARIRMAPGWRGDGEPQAGSMAYPRQGDTPSRRASDLGRSHVANLDINASIAAYRTLLTPTARYASFDYCYNYFQSFHEQDDAGALADSRHLQASCLQLGFYLASWGMLRGSSVLLQRSMRNFIPVIQAISQTPSDIWAIDADNYSHANCQALIDAATRIRDSFPDSASDILVTKTLLGVFGCMPAFDQYFKKGFAVSTLSTRSLQKIGAFYEQHAAAIESNRVPTISFDTGLSTNRRYPRAKVIDMIFFVAGGGSASLTDLDPEPSGRDA